MLPKFIKMRDGKLIDTYHVLDVDVRDVRNGFFKFGSVSVRF